jgi:hypothetical protein
MIYLLCILMMVSNLARAETPRTANWPVANPVQVLGDARLDQAHEEFLPLHSNTDPRDEHPAAMVGQEWDPAAWNGQWTAENTIQRLFANHTFVNHYVRNRMVSGRVVPVVEVGATFYHLSGLDQRRALKLLTDHHRVFAAGLTVVELRDGRTHQVIGQYTPQGLFLN